MKRFFADTAYWLALTNSFDQYHARAVEVSETVGHCQLFTTDAVLTEFLDALADKGRHIGLRQFKWSRRSCAIHKSP